MTILKQTNQLRYLKYKLNDPCAWAHTATARMVDGDAIVLQVAWRDLETGVIEWRDVPVESED